MRITRMWAAAALVAGVVACQEKKEEAKPAAPAAAPAPAAAAPAGGGDKILIGHIGSMSGNEATFGQSTDNGVKLAIEEQNKKGGIKGKQLALKTLDDQGKPEEAAVAATRLITQDKVAVLIGEVASSRSLAIAPIADANQVPQITPTSTNPKVTKDGDKTRPFVFRVCFIDPFQGTVMAKFASENLKIKNVAVLRDVGNDYSVGLADFFIKALTGAGGKIVADQSYKAGDQDFKAQLTAIRGKKPEAIYVPGYYTDVAL
ncbi:MAG TPA: ABC transporter substrate-binding protein, partial [Anaeromyxobacteraceae bacterium]|nr:ABC transporter substrate-binding protein [Anaeromyxobacteraceae bacterium]